jgi:hypothetical protein
MMGWLISAIPVEFSHLGGKTSSEPGSGGQIVMKPKQERRGLGPRLIGADANAVGHLRRLVLDDHLAAGWVFIH